jgi:hypothetical protein
MPQLCCDNARLENYKPDNPQSGPKAVKPRGGLTVQHATLSGLQQACHTVVLLCRGLTHPKPQGSLTVQPAAHSGLTVSMPLGGLNAVKPQSGLAEDEPQGDLTIQHATRIGLTASVPRGSLTAVYPRNDLTDNEPQRRSCSPVCHA